MAGLTNLCHDGVCTFTPRGTEEASEAQSSPETARDDALIPEVSAADFKRRVLDSPIPVVVEFFRPVCSRCKQAAPRLEALARANQGRVRVVKVDVDRSPDLATRYRVGPLPHLVGISEGRVLKSVAGKASVQTGALDPLFSR